MRLLATTLLILLVATAQAEMATVAIPAGFAVGDRGPASVSPFAADPQRSANRSVVAGDWTWYRLEAGAAQVNAAGPSHYVAGIRGTLFSWTSFWNRPAPVPDGINGGATQQSPPEHTYQPPEGQPQPNPTDGLQDPTRGAGRIPSPAASSLGLIGVLLLAMARRHVG